MVVDMTDAEIDLVFGALADSTRRSIIARVIVAEQSVSTLASQYLVSFAAIQKHVAVLERASLVRKQRRGREQIVHGNPETLARAARLLDSYEEIWRQRTQRIDAILAEEETHERN
ncbi:helix-turn-helix domain-containing protein [Salinibacterium sp.]|uniref:ArsR/SmtB family transcription factor n=1 Tax=Salinibacterium sp. TaxID=1915057 RepID=UPI00286C36A2|nr:helix-turn-helix domain-containing protein [Salinibacterium sp.]